MLALPALQILVGLLLSSHFIDFFFFFLKTRKSTENKIFFHRDLALAKKAHYYQEYDSGISL